MQKLLDRITLDPEVLAGKPIIRGMRISVEQILKALGNNVPIDDLLADYPDLERADILACLQYASRLVADERIYPVGAA